MQMLASIDFLFLFLLSYFFVFLFWKVYVAKPQTLLNFVEEMAVNIFFICSCQVDPRSFKLIFDFFFVNRGPSFGNFLFKFKFNYGN